MTTRRVVVFVAAFMAAAVLSVSAGGKQEGAAAAPATLTKVSQVTNWFAEPELAGQYAAVSKGFYKDAGLDMTIIPGGPSVSSTQIVASGKADFGVTEADGILLARKEGIPIVAIAAIFQKNPQCFVYHKEDSSITDFSSFNGHQVFISPAAPFWEYIKKAYKLDGVKEVAYTGQLAPFIADKTSVTQGYVTSEPFALGSQGVNVGSLLIYDSGYQPYTTLLFTTEKMIKEKPQLVARFVQASIKGWLYYKDNYQEINQSAIKTANPDLTMDSMNYGAKTEMDLVFGQDAAKSGVGTMTKARWDALGAQLKDLGLIPADMDVSKAYTTEFLPPQ